MGCNSCGCNNGCGCGCGFNNWWWIIILILIWLWLTGGNATSPPSVPAAVIIPAPAVPAIPAAVAAAAAATKSAFPAPKREPYGSLSFYLSRSALFVGGNMLPRNQLADGGGRSLREAALQ